MAHTVDVDHDHRLEAYETAPHLAEHVRDLRREAAAVASRLEGRKIWMVNSTAQGGGVAEMLPALNSVLRDVGLDVRWAVIDSSRPDFFPLTKRLHNMIHGVAGPALSEADRRLYDEVSQENADSLADEVSPDDVVVVHDPQPLGAGVRLKRRLGLPLIWRCHIGREGSNEATDEAWAFLKPDAQTADRAIFSTAAYIPAFLTHRASILYPAIDPFSHKNRELRPHKLAGVLCNAGLSTAHHPVVTDPFEHTAQRLTPEDTFWRADQADLGLLYRPTITQISRWDRLKGFVELLEAFTLLKQELAERPPADERTRRRLALVRLVLAGPDPAGIQDDPEAVEVLGDLRRRFCALPPSVQDDVGILLLPMASGKENALMVNVLQRCSSLVAQMSLQEGFGLTATEAMWKRVPVIGTRACGLRQQVRSGIDGLLVEDPRDHRAVSRALADALSDPWQREAWGNSGQRRVHEEFLLFRQARRWVAVLNEVA